MVPLEVVTPEELGRSIRRLRKEKGWTQARLAEWLGVNPVTVMRMERGGPVAVTNAVRALSLLGAKVVIVPKWATVTAGGQEPQRG